MIRAHANTQLQTFDDNAARKASNLARVLELNGFTREVGELHKAGAGVYLTVNETDGKGRKAQNIRRIRAVWQEDDEGFEGEFPLEPSMVVETSEGHYHRYWLVGDAWPADEKGRADFAAVMARMVETYGCDKSAKDICRVLRIPASGIRKTRPSRTWSASLAAPGGATRERRFRGVSPCQRKSQNIRMATRRGARPARRASASSRRCRQFPLTIARTGCALQWRSNRTLGMAASIPAVVEHALHQVR